MQKFPEGECPSQEPESAPEDLKYFAFLPPPLPHLFGPFDEDLEAVR